MVGVNAAGIFSKLTSFDDMLFTLSPSVFFIQETKLYTAGKIKTTNSQNYQIFELNRTNKSGGGLAIGALNDIEPVLISEGDDETEIIVVEISASRLEIRCICGYGPQENHNLEKKKKFWERLTIEVEEAIENGKAIIIQMDGNLWAGPEIIRNDPHKCNQNGQFFKEFLKLFPNLYIANNLDLCEGLITRRRQTVNKLEESVLDFFIVCDKILPFVSRMIVDEEQNFVLSNYSKIKGNQIIKKSDHNPIILELLLEYSLKKPDRIETFNFRNKECQTHFLKSTDSSGCLTKCFLKAGKTDRKCENWFKTLRGQFHKSFKRIRFTNKPKASKINKILEERRNLINKLKKSTNHEKEVLNDKLSEIEGSICNLVYEDNYSKVVDNLKQLGDEGGNIQPLGIWKIKRKLFPKNRESLPFAKKNCDGKIITSQHQLKSLYLDTFTHRLRHRLINDKYKYLKDLKEELWKQRLKQAQNVKSKKWTKNDLIKILKSLKSNKSRDPHGIVNELFKPGVIGQDLFNSMLMLFNQVKETLIIPKFMELCNIVGIYKGKGDKMDLNNDRGIFIVNIFRSILMKLIYSDKYKIIDKSMSDSNVGARRKKNIRNHIFIINGIIQEALCKKSEPVDLVIVDYRQCFDSLWLEECCNDLFEAGVNDDQIALIYKMNSKNQVAVKTPFGVSERKTVERIVLQGEVFGPLQCSVTIDTFGKECIEEQKNLYMYKGEVGVPPLAMIDDVICPVKCGLKSVEVTAFINAKSSAKKIQFGVDKCHQLHIGRKKELCPDLHIDSWGIKKMDEAKTGFKNLIDVQIDDHKIENVEKDKYLGDIITTDGNNMRNVVARKAKSVGIIKQIHTMLNEVCYGPYHFEVAMLFRKSFLLNGILTNSEAWYNVKSQEIEMLEKCDENLIQSLLETPRTAAKCMLYLETGAKPIRFTMMKRRLMFLHYILNEPSESLIKRFFIVQDNNPAKNDWCSKVKEDLEYLEIFLSFENIQYASSYQFKALIEKAIDEKCFSYLDSEKKQKSKVSHIQYNKHTIQEYLKDNRISNQLKKFIFALRARMLDVGQNYPNKYQTKHCPVCRDEKSMDTQEHILVCAELNHNKKQVTQALPKYEDLFGKDVPKQIAVAKIIFENFKVRTKKLKEIYSE